MKTAVDGATDPSSSSGSETLGHAAARICLMGTMKVGGKGGSARGVGEVMMALRTCDENWAEIFGGEESEDGW